MQPGFYRATITPQSTHQEIQDHLKAACEAGNFPAMCGVTCKYRLKIGDVIKACAIGIFIPEDRYINEFDTTYGIILILNKLKDVFPPFFSERDSSVRKLTFAERLQLIHDHEIYWDKQFTEKQQWSNDRFLRMVKELFAEFGYNVV